MSTTRDKMSDLGQTVGEAAKNIGNKIAEKTGMGRAPAGEGLGAICEHMDVIASCGKKVGVVDHVEGEAIKLTKNDSPDGQHHFIPAKWVDHVDAQVHLTENSKVTEENWKPDAASCGCNG